MDQINPLAEMTHKRRISVWSKWLKRDHISAVIRISTQANMDVYVLLKQV